MVKLALLRKFFKGEADIGYGDDIMASGFARGAHARGKRVAFGDGRRIIWGQWSEEVFRYNPNVASPGSEGDRDIEWNDFYKGHRSYNAHSPERWIWNMDFRPPFGQLFFDDNESAFADSVPDDFILIEPNVPNNKSVAPNKQWSVDRFQQVADRLMMNGENVIQLIYPTAKYMLRGVQLASAGNFRNALAVLSQAKLYIGPEGGLHHGAAALLVPAVVIFGGFIPPQVTGYPTHANLTGGAEACGSLLKCDHCRKALDAITVRQVLEAAETLRNKSRVQ